VVLVMLTVGQSRAELVPKQVAVVAMSSSAESQELARHYLKVRAIPEANLLLLPGKPSESLPREVWDAEVRPAIRKWLTQHSPKGEIRCFVTCWDVPLKIGRRPADSPELVQRQEFLTAARKGRVAQMTVVLKALRELGQVDAPAKVEPLAEDAPLADVAARLDAEIKAARDRIMATSSQPKQVEASQTLQGALVLSGGLAQLHRMAIAAAKTRGAESAEADPQLAMLTGRLQGLQQGLQALSALPDSPARDAQFMNLLQATGGAIGVIQWTDKELEALEKNETHSSFDSELSLVLWDDYPLSRWQPNILHYRFDHAPGRETVLMVSRLAAPTLELAKGLVDKAVAVEKTGLVGKVYVDARGMSHDPEKSQPGSYDQYDQSLRDLAERIKKHTKLEVVLDDKPELFQSGACPDAALYCGWYSLAKYVDAFDWRPGAVGYHLASGEAATLRKPGGTAWCNAMLEDGITATLGPVSEPYLMSFPMPDDFFSLLLAGRHTLVEVYYRTKPFNSWMMVLVGDPLYNPFKAKPALNEKDLPEYLQAHPTPPADTPGS